MCVTNYERTATELEKVQSLITYYIQLMGVLL